MNDFETMIPVQPEFLGVQSCTGECHSRGYPFAAIQDAKFCMCSKREYRRYGMASDENDCATQCLAGSEDEKCGGPWKNAVYEIGEFGILQHSWSPNNSSLHSTHNSWYTRLPIAILKTGSPKAFNKGTMLPSPCAADPVTRNGLTEMQDRKRPRN